MNTTLSKEQREQRLGKFTGSQVHKLMGVKGFGKTGETYIFETAAEFLTGQPAKLEAHSQTMQWGIDHELEAQLYFEAATGCKIRTCETLSNDFIAGTPDGILLEPCETTGFEIKCPANSGEHLKNLSMQKAEDLFDLRTEYYWQCLSYMWLTGLNKWKFCSYDPRFKEEKRMLILNIEMNPAHLKLLQERVTEANLFLQNIISKL